MSSLSYGIYLIHPLVLMLLSFIVLPVKMTTIFMAPLFSILTKTAITFIISYSSVKHCNGTTNHSRAAEYAD